MDERTEEFDIPGGSYVGDEITDEHAFEALAGKGIGVFVGRVDDPEMGGRTTAADFVLHSIGGGGAIPEHARTLTVANA